LRIVDRVAYYLMQKHPSLAEEKQNLPRHKSPAIALEIGPPLTLLFGSCSCR